MNASTFDEFGRMQANLGLEAQPPVPGAQNVVLYPFVNPATELIDATNLPKASVTYSTTTGLPVSDVKMTPISTPDDGTQIWRITHNGVDTHPIHFHLFDVQLLNRVGWDGIIRPPDANELGDGSSACGGCSFVGVDCDSGGRFSFSTTSDRAACGSSGTACGWYFD